MNWQSIFYFLGWAALFAIMMRLGCGAHVTGHKHHSSRGSAASGELDDGSAGPPSDTARDPVCNMQVPVATAKSAVFQGQTYHFCSSACRERFEAAPTQYSSSPGPAEPGKEHRHGCC